MLELLATGNLWGLTNLRTQVQQYERARLILGPNASKSGVLDKDKRHAPALQLLGHVLFMQVRSLKHSELLVYEALGY